MTELFISLRVFASVAVSIFLEAAPFLLLGSLISAGFEHLVPQERLARWTPQGRLPAVGLGLVAGMILPTCECGVVPITRRLLSKGVNPAAAITYMLSAPVINPVVIISTLVAFQGNYWMVLGRVALVALPAAVLGWTLGAISPRALLRHPELVASVQEGPVLPSLEPAAHVHGPGCGHDHGHYVGPTWVKVLAQAAGEFMEMGKYLLIGSLAAALFKTLLPSEVMMLFKGNIFLAVGAMMLLAILLSVCSEADAFVAASFSAFPAASQLAFVALGPMVDLKLIATFWGVFHPRVAMALILIPCLLIFLWSVLLGVYLA